MEPREFADGAPRFYGLSKVEQTIAFAWYLHAHKGASAFSAAQLRDVFRQASVEPPDLSIYLPRLVAKKPPQLRQTRDLYRVEEGLRKKLDVRYGSQTTTVAVASLLASLPAKVPNLAERAFLAEALNCYRVRAYRAAIVMAWNLAFDHVRRWVMAEPSRLANFNASLQAKYPKKGLVIVAVDDFDDLKEKESIETLKHAKLITANVAGILEEKLRRRNRVAHPSSIEVTQAQADDAITDLVNNVVLALV